MGLNSWLQKKYITWRRGFPPPDQRVRRLASLPPDPARGPEGSLPITPRQGHVRSRHPAVLGPRLDNDPTPMRAPSPGELTASSRLRSEPWAIEQLPPPPDYADILQQTPPPPYTVSAPQIEPLRVEMPAGALETVDSMPAAAMGGGRLRVRMPDGASEAVGSMPAAAAGGSRVAPSAASASRHANEAATEERAASPSIEEVIETGVEVVIRF